MSYVVTEQGPCLTLVRFERVRCRAHVWSNAHCLVSIAFPRNPGPDAGSPVSW